MYIEEHDERRKYIESQIGGVGMTVVLSMGTLVAGLFNETVFFTLLCTMVLTCFVMLGLKFYYHAKV